MAIVSKANAVLKEQWAMAHNFYGNPSTRTPILIIWVASFGGALHSSVTTYFYLEVGANNMDIGRIGFIQSLGSLLFAPLAGYALDHGVNVFGPLITTATACSVGCLWRGMADSVMDLYIGAAMLSIGVNLWAVVLLHIAHCTPRDHRSHVLSAFSVQETGLRLLGKAVFPIWNFGVQRTLQQLDNDDYNTTLFRYRIHMGICTLFCFFGTLALLAERRALLSSEDNLVKPTHSTPPKAKVPTLEVGLASPDAHTHVHANNVNGMATHKAHGTAVNRASIHFRFVAVLSALLIQSLSSTIVTVLWPLVLRDQFQFSAAEYGLVSVVASICSTASIASFPTVERHVGRIRTAACGATLASVACFLAFVVLPNLSNFFEGDILAGLAVERETNPDAVLADSNENLGPFQQRFLAHAFLAIMFQSAVHTLEPSLKSIVSTDVHVSMQNRSLGLMSTLGGIGAMGGNLIGTFLFQRSKDDTNGIGVGWLGNGALPFAAVAGVLAVASLFLWALEWGESRAENQSSTATKNYVCDENGLNGKHTHETSPDGSVMNAVNGIHVPDQSGIFYPLLQMDTSYEMKLD